MNRAALHVWRSLTSDGSLRSLKYTFGPVTANTLAVRLDDGSWMVVSPATGAPASVLEDLAKDGAVSALVAPNAFHHRGQEAWRRRFPDAVSYAPEGSLARLSRKSAAVPYRAIAELTRKLSSSVAVFLPDGQKTPDMLVRASRDGETVWWMGDQFSNLTADDQIWLMRVLAPVHDFLVGSGLGYRRNGRPELVYVNDRAAWLRSIRAVVERDPPSIVMPAHGDPVVEDTAARTRLVLNDLPGKVEDARISLDSHG